MEGQAAFSLSASYSRTADDGWQALETGRFPVDIYPGWLRGGLTYIIPVVFIITVPAQALDAASASTSASSNRRLRGSSTRPPVTW